MKPLTCSLLKPVILIWGQWQGPRGTTAREPRRCYSPRTECTYILLHTYSYRVPTAGGNQGSSAVICHFFRWPAISARIRKVIFSGIHRKRHFQTEKCFCLWSPGKSELKYLGKESLEGAYLFTWSFKSSRRFYLVLAEADCRIELKEAVNWIPRI